MDQVHVRESNSEVVVFLDKNVGDPVIAMEEAIRLLKIEVIRAKSGFNGNSHR